MTLQMRAARTILHAAIMLVLGCSAGTAQTFLYYKCEDGTQFITMTVNESRALYMQLDGRSYTLPRRLAYGGERFSKSGVSFWIRGDAATLKRSRTPRTVCRATR